MKVCTEEDKKVLIKNKKNILTLASVLYEDSNHKFIKILLFFGIFLCVLVISFSFLMGLSLLLDINLIESALVQGLFEVLTLTGACLLTYLISKKSTKAKAFGNVSRNIFTRDIRISNGFYLNYRLKSNENSYLIIDEDQRDSAGNPYTIVMPVTRYDNLSKMKNKERILIVKGDRGEYIPMKLNDTLESLLDKPAIDINSLNIPSLHLIRHPNIKLLMPNQYYTAKATDIDSLRNIISGEPLEVDCYQKVLFVSKNFKNKAKKKGDAVAVFYLDDKSSLDFHLLTAIDKAYISNGTIYGSVLRVYYKKLDNDNLKIQYICNELLWT